MIFKGVNCHAALNPDIVSMPPAGRGNHFPCTPDLPVAAFSGNRLNRVKGRNVPCGDSKGAEPLWRLLADVC
jgi:hypothetical protein